jgi:hypothetical protein
MRQRVVKVVFEPSALVAVTLTSQRGSTKPSAETGRSMLKTSSPVRPSDAADWPSAKHRGRHAHADEVGAVDAFEALGDDRPHAQQQQCLGRPVAARAHAVVLACEHDQRRALGLVVDAGVVMKLILPAPLADMSLVQPPSLILPVQGSLARAFLMRTFGEGAAGHDAVVAATAAVAVEVGLATRQI